MARHHKIIVPPGKTRERLDVFLTHQIENATRTKIQEAIEAGLVVVNGKQERASHKVTPDDIIDVTIPKQPSPDVLPENIPLNIVYEDDYLIVINKPADMVTHPAYGNYSGTLVNALLYHCNGKLANSGGDELIEEEATLHKNSDEPINTRAGIVHRLDKDTSGLIVIAKDDVTHAKLAKQFSDRTINREYWAIVWGLFGKKKKGIVEANLARSKTDRKKVAVSERGRFALTEYEVMKEFDFLSLIKLKLRTGRTHQIRVHMHHIDHPVFGDPTYGGRRITYGEAAKKNKSLIHEMLKMLPRQALHAKTLGFIHPHTNKHLVFDSNLPHDMWEILKKLEKE